MLIDVRIEPPAQRSKLFHAFYMLFTCFVVTIGVNAGAFRKFYLDVIQPCFVHSDTGYRCIFIPDHKFRVRKVAENYAFFSYYSGAGTRFYCCIFVAEK